MTVQRAVERLLCVKYPSLDQERDEPERIWNGQPTDRCNSKPENESPGSEADGCNGCEDCSTGGSGLTVASIMSRAKANTSASSSAVRSVCK